MWWLKGHFLFKKGQEPRKGSGRQDHGGIRADQRVYVCVSVLRGCGHVGMDAADLLLMKKSVEFPPDSVHTFESNDHVTVEKDGEVRTQST